MKVSYFSVIKWILLLTVVFLSACAGFGDGETAVLPPTPTIASPTSVPTKQRHCHQAQHDHQRNRYFANINTYSPNTSANSYTYRDSYPNAIANFATR